MKKAPLKSPKNFWATDAKHWVSVPKAAYQPVRRTARCPQGGFGNNILTVCVWRYEW